MSKTNSKIKRTYIQESVTKGDWFGWLQRNIPLTEAANIKFPKTSVFKSQKS